MPDSSYIGVNILLALSTALSYLITISSNSSFSTTGFGTGGMGGSGTGGGGSGGSGVLPVSQTTLLFIVTGVLLGKKLVVYTFIVELT